MFLTGQKIIPKKLVDAKFGFVHPVLEGALRSILAPAGRR